MMDLQTVAYEHRLLLVAINWLLCSVVGMACVCRIAKMTKPVTRKRFRAAYVGLLLAATMSGYSWLFFGEWPGPGQIALAAALIVLLGFNAGNWAHGTPDYARSGPAPLDAIPDHQLSGVVGRGKDPS